LSDGGSRGPSGLLLVDKPCGPTSHDVVALARRISGQRKVGHTGTLDPPASGLLPLAFGRATRLIRFFPSAPKVYTGSFVLGRTTRTDDLEGETLSVHDGPLPDAAATRAAAGTLVGASRQVPPRVSARKVGGRRMYDLARKGVEVEARATPIEVFRFDVEPLDESDRFGFEVEVSAGTYVRGLVRDLGDRLGCGAALAGLRRTRIGPWRVEGAIALDPDEPAARERLLAELTPLRECPLDLPRVELDRSEDARAFAHGRRVELPACPSGGPLAIFDRTGELLGVAEAAGNAARPLVVLVAPDR
jgi:tRNA pseudouridine55 synthase